MNGLVQGKGYILEAEAGEKKGRIWEMSILGEEILWEREMLISGNGDEVLLCEMKV